MNQQSTKKRRRAFVIIAVLIIVGSAMFVATALLFQAQADVASAARTADIAQSRSLAWSGIQAVMSTINGQRQRMLEGMTPRVERQYVLYETPARLGIIRLLPLGLAGEHVVPEAGKLDLNSIDAAALENTGMVDAATAAAIVAFRGQQPGGRFQSVADLLRLPGGIISAEMLYGPISELNTRDQSDTETDSVGDRVAARLSEPHVRGLDDVLTVFAVEPALQMSGLLRINLNVSWSDELARKVESRFGPEAVGVLKQIFESGARFHNEASVFQTLRQFKTPPENWPQILDTFTTEAGTYHMGRLDLNTATYEALKGLPGISPEQAAQLARVRDELSSDERRTIAWPAITQILPPESYDALAGHVTTRSWTFRVRLAAGEVSVDQPDAAMSGRMVYEAVLDFSAPQPRVAYVRDLTAWESAAQLAAAAAVRHSGEADRLTPTADDEPADDVPSEADFEPAATSPDEPRLAADRHLTSRRSESQNSVGQPHPTPVAGEPSTRRIGRWRSGDS